MEIKALLILYSSIVVVNTIVSLVLYLNYRNDYYRSLCFVWLSASVIFVIQGIAAEGSDYLRVLAFGTSIATFFMFSRLLAILANIDLKFKKYIYLQLGGLIITSIFHLLKLDVNLMALPLVITTVLPMFVVASKALLFHRHKLTMMLRFYSVTLLISSFHGADFAIAFNIPELAFPGYAFGTILIFSLATFSMAAVSESVAMEATKVKLEAQIAANIANAAKLLALGEMAGGVAHEVNNPLQAVKGMNYVLRRLINKPSLDKDKINDSLNVVDRSADRIVEIVSALKNLGRDASQDPLETVPLAIIVKQTLNVCQVQLESLGIDLQIEEMDPSVKVICRSNEISQVFLNLINNAIDAVISCDEKWIRISHTLTSKHVLLRIEDSGKGVPKENREKIFQPFFTTKEVGKGAGLGLSVARAMVRNSNGELFYDQNASHTCFVIKLPLSLV